MQVLVAIFARPVKLIEERPRGSEKARWFGNRPRRPTANVNVGRHAKLAHDRVRCGHPWVRAKVLDAIQFPALGAPRVFAHKMFSPL